MATMPTTIDEVTLTWLAETTGWNLEAVTIERIGVGIGVSSAVYRVHLRGPGSPETVVVKLPALDAAAVFTSTMLRMYLRETRFFLELAHQTPIRVPRCHHAEIDAETSQFVLVMEDVGHLRAVDQVVGMGIPDAERAIDGLARWHATWWRQADELAGDGLTVSLGDEIYKAVLPLVFAEGWDKLMGEVEIPAAIQAVGPRWIDAMPRLLDGLADVPTTMVHGDFRADNLLFDGDGSVVALDFQLVGTGHGAYDLAYFVTQSITAADASDQEQALFGRWIAGLERAGVPRPDLSDSWEKYRAAALFCLAYPVVAWRGMDVTDPRQRDLATTMLERFDRAVTELDLVSLL